MSKGHRSDTLPSSQGRPDNVKLKGRRSSDEPGVEVLIRQVGEYPVNPVTPVYMVPVAGR